MVQYEEERCRKVEKNTWFVHEHYPKCKELSSPNHASRSFSDDDANENTEGKTYALSSCIMSPRDSNFSSYSSNPGEPPLQWSLQRSEPISHSEWNHWCQKFHLNWMEESGKEKDTCCWQRVSSRESKTV